MPSYGVELDGDLLAVLRRHDPPVIARSRDDRTMLDLRSVAPADDDVIVAALTS
jgi:L-seryl-tRNA(Ser) seleniumtransferase